MTAVAADDGAKWHRSARTMLVRPL